MNKILVPVDLSPNSMATLSYATDIAKTLQSQIVVFYSYPIPFRNAFQSLEAIQQLEKAAETEAHGRVKGFMDQFLSERPDANSMIVRTVSRLGIPIENIITLVESNEFQLLIMGTKGATNLQTKFLGTNTAVILDNVNQPVLVVPSQTVYRNIQKIVFATDFSEQGLSDVKILVNIASAFQAKILLLHVENNKLSDNFLTQKLAFAKQKLKYNKISIHHLLADEVEEGINNFLRTEHADLLAMTIRQRNIFQRIFFPSLTKHMSLYSDIPMLVMHSR